MGVIYVRPNLINGKKYVGQATTKNFKSRQNRWKSNSYRYAGKAINAARAKYGIEAFGFEILKECDDKELNFWEKYYIKELNTKVPYGYNMTDGGDSTYEMTDEIRKKISAALKGKPKSPEHIAKVAARSAAAQRGKPKPKVSDALKGRKLSTETRKKISEAKRGKHYPKVAAAHRGKKLSDEAKAKISDALKGKPNPKVAAAQSKPVQALKDENVVYEFPSAMEAERQGYGNHRLISSCCNGKRKTHKGFIWRYAV